MSSRGPDRLVVGRLVCAAPHWEGLDFKCRVQSRELEGRSCHVSLFAHEPSSLQRSTTLSPCTLFSPYSGPTWSTATPSNTTTPMTTTTTTTLFLSISLTFLPRTAKTAPPSRCSFPSLPPLTLLKFPLTCGALQPRTTLTSWRTPWTCRPSSGSWTRGSTKSPGSTSRISGWCSTTPGCTTARPPASTNTAPSWPRCLRRRSTPSCRAWDTAVGGRWGGSGVAFLILISNYSTHCLLAFLFTLS